MAIKNMAAIFVLFALSINLMLVAGDSDCDILTEWHGFLKGAIEKFVPKEYQAPGCLDFFLKKPNSQCDIKTLFRPIDTANCKEFRKNVTKTKYYLGSTTSAVVAHPLYTNDIDGEEVCDSMHNFNRKPAAEKTKDKYAEVYKSSAVYLPYSYLEYSLNSCEKDAVAIAHCVIDANDKARKFFGNIPAVEWEIRDCK